MMQFVRRYGVRIGIGVVLSVGLYAAIATWTAHRREQRIVDTLESQDVLMLFRNRFPDFVPVQLQLLTVEQLHAGADRPAWIATVNSDADRLDVTDEVVATFAELPNLEVLDLNGTRITDSGLAHLKGLANLRDLNLTNTQTTAEGRDKLRKALPKCAITPNP